MRLIQLIEGDLKSVRLSDVVNRRYIDDFINGVHWDQTANRRKGRPYATDDAIQMLDSWREISPETIPEHLRNLDDADIVKTKEYRQYLTKWATARFDEVKERLSQIPSRGGKIAIHRVIRVSDEWFERVRQRGKARLGVYWTYDLVGWEEETGAEPVWAKGGGTDIVVRALVEKNRVDWPDTIRANMDWYSGDREYELRLFPHTPIQVTSVRTLDERRSIRLKDVAFTA